MPATCRSKIGDRTFAVAGPRAWNSLPPAVCTSATYNTFKKALKSHLFGLSFSLWQLCILTMYSALVVVYTTNCALQIVRLTLHCSNQYGTLNSLFKLIKNCSLSLVLIYITTYVSLKETLVCSKFENNIKIFEVTGIWPINKVIQKSKCKITKLSTHVTHINETYIVFKSTACTNRECSTKWNAAINRIKTHRCVRFILKERVHLLITNFLY